MSGRARPLKRVRVVFGDVLKGKGERERQERQSGARRGGEV